MDKTLILKPLITEKATALGALNKYVFIVSDRATAPEVKKVIEAEYKVKVSRVQMLKMLPKKKRMGRAITMKKGGKKAIVTLPEGQKIDILNR